MSIESAPMARLAGDGQIYVCSVCGRSGKDLLDFGDAACMANSMLCHDTPMITKGRLQYVPVDSGCNDCEDGLCVRCRP
jgi:hypothetical protein